MDRPQRLEEPVYANRAALLVTETRKYFRNLPIKLRMPLCSLQCTPGRSQLAQYYEIGSSYPGSIPVRQQNRPS